MEETSRTLADMASADISTVSARTTVGQAAARVATARWVVVTDADEQPMGLLSSKRLARADDGQQVGDLITRPAIVLPSHLSVAESLRSRAFHDLGRELIDLDGVIVVADDRPIGVWAGRDLGKHLPFTTVRGLDATYHDSGLPGPIINIGRILRSCRFVDQASRRACRDSRSFSGKPDPLPACRNPLKLAPHSFRW